MYACSIANVISTFVIEDHIVDWHSCQICYPLEIKILLLLINFNTSLTEKTGGARWLSGRVSDSGARGPGFETYRRHVVSLSKTLYSPKVLVNYPGSDGSVPT